MKVAVVIPAFQEERIIARTLSRVPAAAAHIVVVDDGSFDKTSEIVANVARADDRITLVTLGVNRGVGRAIAIGYRQARLLGADAAVVMAGDDQMDPEDYPGLVAALENADYVKGNRLLHADARDMPLVRRIGTRTLAVATRVVSGCGPIDDSQCGYTALRLSLLDAIDIDGLYPRYGYPNDLLARVARAGGRISEVPVRPVYADEVSGFRAHQVVVPISKILGRIALRRLRGS